MSLSDQYRNAGKEETVKATAKALRDLKTQLDTIWDDVMSVNAEARQVAKWYYNNAADTAYEAATSGLILSQSRVEENITTAESDKNREDVQNFINGYNTLVEADPQPGMWSSLWGSAQEKRLAYLDKIEDDGSTFRIKARNELDKKAEELRAVKDEKFAYVSQLRDFYAGLSAAVQSGDLDGLEDALKSTDTIRVKDLRSLLAKPIDDAPNILTAVINKIDEPQQEAEAIARVLNAFNDKSVAQTVIQNAVRTANDDATRDTLVKYRDAFMGLFVEADGMLINRRQIARTRVRSRNGTPNTHVELMNMRGYGADIYFDTEEETNELMALFSDQEQLVKVKDSYIGLNQMARTRHRKQENGTYYLETMDMRGNGADIYGLTEEELNAFFATLDENPSFIKVKDTYVNVNHVARTRHREQENGTYYLEPMDMRGNGPDIYGLTKDDLDAFFAALDERPNFIKIKDTYVNVNHVARTRYREQENGTYYLEPMDMRGNGPDIYGLTKDDLDAFFTALDERPNFIKVKDTYVNASHLARTRHRELEDGTYYLEPMDTHGNGPDIRGITKDELNTFFAALDERPNFIKVKDTYVNANHIGRTRVRERENGLHLEVMDTRGYGADVYDLTQDEVDSFHKELLTRPNFIDAKGQIVNVSRIGRTRVRERDEGYHLELMDMNGYGADIYGLTEDELKAIYEDIERVGRKIALMQQGMGQRAAFNYGLKQARQWETGYRSSHRDTDSLMDYLPLIIVAAMVFHNTHEDQLEAGASNNNGAEADADASLSAENSTANDIGSDMADMETSGIETDMDLTNDFMDVASFEQDFSAMEADYSSDYSGSDYSSSDFGSSGMDMMFDSPIGMAGGFGGFDGIPGTGF